MLLIGLRRLLAMGVLLAVGRLIIEIMPTISRNFFFDFPVVLAVWVALTFPLWRWLLRDYERHPTPWFRG